MRRITILLMSIIMLLAGAIGVSAEASAEDLDYSVWNPEDFTYEYMEQRLYGCDYSRDFTIKGQAVKGFSETGLLKLEKNKALVLPRKDTEGNTVVGVCESAFRNCGLTSVRFPSGMMVPYDDTLTNVITKRGNYVIASAAFSGNELTEVTLPSGVIAVMPNAFLNNKIESVTLSRTIWWIENQAFAKNRISTVNFPTSCDFQLEMHGLTFANNRIRSVRLPDYTTVVNKTVFALNPGKEEISPSCPDKQKLYTDIDGNACTAGVVYMYTDNAALADSDRIHHDAKPTESQYSYYQKLIVNDGTEGTQNTDSKWVRSDFIIEGTVIKGLSESGAAKRSETTSLILPDRNAEGEYITEIAPAAPAGTGLFATAEEQFKYVELPSHLKKIGDYAFQNSGVEECLMPPGLTSIGICAFQTNNLESVILPDTVTELGEGAFATNKDLKTISLSGGLAEIPDAAFGCSDKYHYMTGLTEIEIPEGITRIGKRAFAGNNFHNITIPSTVREIGEYAFSTKNYLNGSCEVELNDGLEVIGNYAFRNKVIKSILIPESVKSIGENTFLKEYSDGSVGVVTTVILTSRVQYEDAVNFPVNESNHSYVLLDTSEWNPVHFVFEEISDTETAITGLSEEGEFLLKKNSSLVIPSEDFNGRRVVSVSDNAFEDAALTSVELPNGLVTIGTNAFKSCKLTSLTLPASVSDIGASAFEGNLLERVDFAGEEGKLALGERAFARNSLVYAVLPERELTVAGDVFA